MQQIALVLAVSLGAAANLGVIGLFLLARQRVLRSRSEFSAEPDEAVTKEWKWPRPPE